VIQVDVHAPFYKGRLVVWRHVHGSAYAGVLGRARSRSTRTEGAEALPRWDPSTSYPRWLLNTWGTLELVNSRSGSNACALIIPDSVNLGRLFEPFEGQALKP
jgi:hypothetical protein